MMFSNIDSYTTPKKRVKTGGAEIDNETKESLKVMKVDSPVIVTACRQFGEKKKFSSHSTTKNYGAKSLTMKDLTDLLCPIFSYKRVGYGNNWYLRAHNHTGTAGDFMQPTGSVKSIAWPSGQQAWIEFIGLPMHNFGGKTVNHTDVFTYDGFGASVSELIAKAADIRNDVQSTHITRPTGTLTMINNTQPWDPATTAKSLRQWKGLAFDYHGGYQEHTFLNVSESQVTIYLQEAQPREVMSGTMQNSQGLNYSTDSIGKILLQDYKMDLPLANTLNPVYQAVDNNNRSTDEITDIGVKVKSSSNTVHRKYLMSKEVKVVLAPGDSYTHRMSFDPFSFMESTWNILSSTMTGRQTTTSTTAYDPPVMLVPMFTKILVVRAHGELGFTANRNPGIIAVNGVGNTSGALAHTCTEKHTCRMLPYQAPYQSFYENYLAGTSNAIHLNISPDGANEVMNVEDNKPNYIDSTGGVGDVNP